ncbi:hypothetical protein B0H16DRAFT_1712963 [Mycena metata]|uniref:Uncharacterized protein n=1 Tax=Mycena metata TaxID=1033252 RepID=A0AAD7K269_9AGAR|nr:hypothetical protein B0H16DRAFT_1712963 [Mycena metata]
MSNFSPRLASFLDAQRIWQFDQAAWHNQSGLHFSSLTALTTIKSHNPSSCAVQGASPALAVLRLTWDPLSPRPSNSSCDKRTNLSHRGCAPVGCRAECGAAAEDAGGIPSPNQCLRPRPSSLDSHLTSPSSDSSNLELMAHIHPRRDFSLPHAPFRLSRPSYCANLSYRIQTYRRSAPVITTSCPAHRALGADERVHAAADAALDATLGGGAVPCDEGGLWRDSSPPLPSPFPTECLKVKSPQSSTPFRPPQIEVILPSPRAPSQLRLTNVRSAPSSSAPRLPASDVHLGAWSVRADQA